MNDVPGVILHAVALENMISDGESYVHDPGRWFGLLEASDTVTLMLGLLFTFVGTAAEFWERAAEAVLAHGQRNRALVVVVAHLPLILLIWLWWPFGLGVAILSWMVVALLYRGASSLGPLLLVSVATTLSFGLPLAIGTLFYRFASWPVIDWLALVAALAWIPEIAIETMYRAWERERHPSIVLCPRLPIWLSNFGLPALIVLLIVIAAGVFSHM